MGFSLHYVANNPKTSPQVGPVFMNSTVGGCVDSRYCCLQFCFLMFSPARFLCCGIMPNLHCGLLSKGAIQAALRDFEAKQADGIVQPKRRPPTWNFTSTPKREAKAAEPITARPRSEAGAAVNMNRT
eukprot:TRINITY_DN66427_c6_g2_i1.p1 TRINITY_DN66427_c6_g2~~TRINITY_DN66427_c6_g2_i1.p1  ORF type:complete len:128 (+),score=0.73 TRINITY_DN66427_c6_g2_i1:543-926(+)